MSDPIILVGFELGDDGWTDDPIRIDMSTLPTKNEVYEQFCELASLYRSQTAALITTTNSYFDFKWHTIRDEIDFESAFEDFWDLIREAICEYVNELYY